MRKPSVLVKIIAWKRLSEELSQHFGTEAERLPNLVQLVLEVASEGQDRGMKQARADEANEPKRRKHRRKKISAAARAKQKGLPSLPERIASVMKPGETVSLNEVVARLKERKIAPASIDVKGYVGNTLANRKDLFRRGKGLRGCYRLRTRKAGTSVPTEATTVKKVWAALLDAPKSYDTMFSHGKFANRLKLPVENVKSVLEQLYDTKIVAKRGGTQWRLKDRDSLRLLLSSKTDEKGSNGALVVAQA